MPSHRTAARRRSALQHRVAGVLGALLLAAAWFLGASPAFAQTPAAAHIRIGHLSPTTPAVDGYVTAMGAPPATEPTVRDVSYGSVSPYLDLAPGRYTVDMRATGSPATSPAAVTSAIEVAAGSSQSLMFFDTASGGAVQGEVLPDQQTAAAAGTGLVRVVQAADGLGPVQIQAAGGPRLASDLQYGMATSYAPVAAHSWDVAIAAGGQKVTATLDVTEGSVTTVVLTRNAAGALVASPVTDVAGSATAPLLPVAPAPAAAPAVPEKSPSAAPAAPTPATPAAPVTPRGGVGAGGGGTAEGPDPLPVVLGIGGAVLLVFALSEARMRRARHRV